MPLLIDGQAVINEPYIFEDLDVFLQKYQKHFAEQASQLKLQTVTAIKPEDQCLFVGQREIGSTSAHDVHIKMIGTDMMTTCHAVVLRCPESKATSLTHFDGCCTAEGVRKMVRAVHSISKTVSSAIEWRAAKHLDLHIIGGFDDDRQLSRDLTLDLLNEFHRLQVEFCANLHIDLRTFCCTSMNSTTIVKDRRAVESPVVFGVAIRIDSGDLLPVEFPGDARAPGALIRAVRLSNCSGQIWNVYDWESGQVVVEAFNYRPYPYAKEWLEQKDEFILQHSSTSPDVEPPDFVPNFRRTIRFTLQHPKPLTSVFKNKPALRFQKCGTSWVQLG